MSLKLGKRFAVFNCVFVAAVLLLTVPIVGFAFEDGEVEPELVSNFVYVPLVLLLAAVGGLIAFHRPGNRIGFGLSVVASLGSIILFFDTYIAYDLHVDPGVLPAVEYVAWATSWLWVLVLLPPLTLLLLLAPDGRLPSPRWRPVFLLDVVMMSLLVVAQAFQSGPFEELTAIENPLGIAALDPLFEAMIFIGFLLLTVAIAASVAALVHRFRRSHGVERQQIKWLALAAAGALAIFLASWVIGFTSDADVWGVSSVLATALFPLATGIAILRHNLYDIDRIINRTLVYVPLTAILAGFFVAVTGLVRTVFTDLTGAGSDAAIAISTLSVVAVLTPVKNQLQAFVDSRFKQQHDPQKALKDLVGEGRLVARVMDRDRFIGSLLEELTGALDLPAALVELPGDNGSGPASYGSRGAGPPALSLPLAHAGRPLGTLQVWRQPDSDAGERHLTESLAAPVEVLSEVIGLLPGRPDVRDSQGDRAIATGSAPEVSEAAEQVG